MILAFLLILIVFGFRLAFRFKLVVGLLAASELGFFGDGDAGGGRWMGGSPILSGGWMGLRFQGWAVVAARGAYLRTHLRCLVIMLD